MDDDCLSKLGDLSVVDDARVLIKQDGSDVYACSNQGLYQLSLFKGDIMLKGIALGYAVTDIDFTDQHIIAATFQHGIKRIQKIEKGMI